MMRETKATWWVRRSRYMTLEETKATRVETLSAIKE